MSWLRELILGNWRNKSVALFFAVTIWFVVFQSEKQPFVDDATVRVVPSDRTEAVVTRVERLSSGEWVNFEDKVTLRFSGPRKQIEELRQSVRVLPLRATLEVEKDMLLEEETSIYTLTAEDFGYPNGGIEIVEMTPDSLRVTQEQAGVKVISNLADEKYLTIRDRPEGYEVGVQRVEPGEVRIHGPKSILAVVKPVLSVSMGGSQTFEGDIEVGLSYPESIPLFVKDSVTWEPNEVRAEIRLKASTATHEAKDVRLDFLFTPPSVPVKFLDDGLTDWRLSLGFEGPKDMIARLEQRLRQPDFAVAVKVPQLADLEPGGFRELTFTEGDLKVLDFPDILVLPHTESSRRLWTYRVVAVKEEEK